MGTNANSVGHQPQGGGQSGQSGYITIREAKGIVDGYCSGDVGADSPALSGALTKLSNTSGGGMADVSLYVGAGLEAPEDLATATYADLADAIAADLLA